MVQLLRPLNRSTQSVRSAGAWRHSRPAAEWFSFDYFTRAKLLIRHCFATLQCDHSCVALPAEPRIAGAAKPTRHRLSFVPVINALKILSGSAAAGLRPDTSHFINFSIASIFAVNKWLGLGATLAPQCSGTSSGAQRQNPLRRSLKKTPIKNS